MKSTPVISTPNMPATLPLLLVRQPQEQPFIAKTRATRGSTRDSSEKNGETRKEGRKGYTRPGEIKG